MSDGNKMKAALIIKIKSVSEVDGGFATITPEENQDISDSITVTASFIEKYTPQPGGFFIMCEGGVALYSE